MIILPLITRKWNNILHRTDNNIALWFVIIAHTLNAVSLSELMDDSTMFSIHGWEAMTLLCVLALKEAKRDMFTLCKLEKNTVR